MRSMSFSEARKHLRGLLESVDQDGKAEIIRRDGRRYLVHPADAQISLPEVTDERPAFSMLDVIGLLHGADKNEKGGASLRRRPSVRRS